MTRRTITIPENLTNAIRTIQAELLVKEQKDITFQGTMIRLLEKAIGKKELEECKSDDPGK